MHPLNHSSRTHKHSSANQKETGADSRHSSSNIPALRDGSTALCRQNSQGKINVTTDTSQYGVDVKPSLSTDMQHREQNSRDCEAAQPAGKTSTSSHQHRASALTSPQKHREKTKHCDSADSDKQKHKHKKRKRSTDARFEGRRISHLVKKRAFNKEENEDNEPGDQRKSDDYVLAKLFRKSGGCLCCAPSILPFLPQFVNKSH